MADMDWVREILRCPRCRGELTDGENQLTCTPCDTTYPITDGIPILLPPPR